MRWIFLSLLLANMSVFLWHQQHEVGQVRVHAEQKAAPVVVRGASSLRLLSELGGDAVSAGSGTSSGQCFLLGGFTQELRVRQLEQRLLSLDIHVRIAVTEVSQGVDQWVYIAPLPSRQAALQMLRELQSRNIDSYLITEGELANGILLGTFPRSDAAVSVVERVRQAGFDAQTRELPRAYHEFWVQVADESRRLVDDALLSRLAGDFSELKHQLISCSGVAYR